MTRAAVDAAAMAWVAGLASEGIQLVDSAGEPLPTASISYSYAFTRACATAIGVPSLASSSYSGIADERARSAPNSGPDDCSRDDISRT